MYNHQRTSLRKSKGHGGIFQRIMLVFNSILALVTLAIFAVGLLIKYGRSVVENFMISFINDMMSGAIETGLGDVVDISTYDFTVILERVAMVLMTLGVVALVVSIFGIMTAKKQHFALTIPYSILVGLFTLFQTAVIVLAVTKRDIVDSAITLPLVDSLQRGYRGYNETDIVSQTWNFIMLTFSCCGVRGYSDFDQATTWRRKIFQDGFWFTMKTPLLCCNLKEKGCYDKLCDKFYTHKGVVIAVVVITILTQVILFLSGVLMSKTSLHQRRKANTRKQENMDSDSSKIESINTHLSDIDSIVSHSLVPGRISQTPITLTDHHNSIPLHHLLNVYRNVPTNNLIGSSIRNGYMNALMNAAMQREQIYNSYESGPYINYDHSIPSTPMPVLVQMPIKHSPVAISKLNSHKSLTDLHSDNFSCESYTLSDMPNSRLSLGAGHPGIKSVFSRQNTFPSSHSGLHRSTSTNFRGRHNVNQEFGSGNRASIRRHQFGDVVQNHQPDAHDTLKSKYIDPLLNHTENRLRSESL